MQTVGRRKQGVRFAGLHRHAAEPGEPFHTVLRRSQRDLFVVSYRHAAGPGEAFHTVARRNLQNRFITLRTRNAEPVKWINVKHCVVRCDQWGALHKVAQPNLEKRFTVSRFTSSCGKSKTVRVVSHQLSWAAPSYIRGPQD